MEPSQLYLDIQSFCKANTDEALVRKYAIFFKTGYDAYGLSKKCMIDKVKELTENKDVTLDLVLQTSEMLVESGKYEETLIAVMLTKQFKKQHSLKVFETIDCWFDIGINNWAHTDTICSELLSELLLKKIINIDNMSHWRTANNKFKRRAIPVAFIKWMKKTGNHTILFNFIEPLMLDSEREVHQGLGWFLREAWKLDKTITEAFLLKWKNDTARLIIQYATEKMTTEQKQRFKKEKIER